MSKITKTICDECKMELSQDEWYFEARIAEACDSSGNAAQICDGDYCKKCFLKKVDIR